jgi:hypothetical protein
MNLVGLDNNINNMTITMTMRQQPKRRCVPNYYWQKVVVVFQSYLHLLLLLLLLLLLKLLLHRTD